MMEEVEVNADKKEPKQKFVVRSLADLQRLKLEKLMKNPEKPVIIPESTNDKEFKEAIPTFVRNVMGSSAGAGSGEFHVYRHLRRKEYARQKFIQQKSLTEKLDQEYREKLDKNKQDSDAKTAKKRAKRLKKKQNQRKKPKTNENKNENKDSTDGSDEENENEENIDDVSQTNGDIENKLDSEKEIENVEIDKVIVSEVLTKPDDVQPI